MPKPNAKPAKAETIVPRESPPKVADKAASPPAKKPTPEAPEAARQPPEAEWQEVAKAPLNTALYCKRTGAWEGSVCSFDGHDWEFHSAPIRSSSDPTALNPMQPPTHWKPISP